jgi:alkylation response protein AidB-like acyl-CoA dehydrogenase
MQLHEDGHERAFRLRVQEFVKANLPGDIRDRVLGFQRVEKDDYIRWQQILHANGWGAPGWPAAEGGAGWSPAERVIFDEECLVAGAPRQLPMGVAMIGPVLIRYGTLAQKARFLPSILNGTHTWCQGYSEPGAGSDLASLSLRAIRDGDDYVLDGQKTWTSYAQWADWMFCLVRTRGEGKPQAGISFLLVDMKSPGITVSPTRSIDGSSDLNEVFFDSVRVPVHLLVGQENEGWTIAKFLLGNERATIAGLGACRRLLAQCQRFMGGRPDDRRLADRLAHLEIELLSHEWSLRRFLAAGDECLFDPVDTSLLKVRGSEIQQGLSTLLMDWAANTGMQHTELLSRLYFDMRKISIFGGTNEVQRTLIAKSLGV